MKICATSDLHGHLPEIPDCDLLLLGGDYYPSSLHGIPQAIWFETVFYGWLKEIASRGIAIVGVPGNHDFYWEREQTKTCPAWTFLNGTSCSLLGMKIHGDGHTPRFYDWAFNADEDVLEAVWKKIPDDTDILVLHGPPRGYGDISYYPQPGREDEEIGPEGIHVGSPSLLKRIQEIQPTLVIAGHIHRGYGVYKIGDHTTFLNVALVNEKYEPTNPPMLVELHKKSVAEEVPAKD